MAKYNVDPAVTFPHHLYQLYSREKPSSLTGLSNVQKKLSISLLHTCLYILQKINATY